MNNELIRILLDYMSQQESDISNLNNKVIGLEELLIMNNHLLGFLSKIIAPFENKPNTPELDVNNDIYNYLLKYCIENDFPLKINNKKMVINSIKAYIALQLFGENVFTMIMNQEDPFIQEALDHLNES